MIYDSHVKTWSKGSFTEIQIYWSVAKPPRLAYWKLWTDKVLKEAGFGQFITGNPI